MRRFLCSLFAAVVALTAVVAPGADGAPEFTAGFGASNSQCGTGEPTAFVDYRRDDDQLPARLYVRTGPDGGCAGQSTAVDASVAWRWPVRGRWEVSVAGGFDRRVVPFEYGCAGAADCVPLPGKLFRGAEVETVSALLGARYDAGDWSVEARYDAVAADWEKGGGVPPISLAYAHRIGPARVEATLMARGVADVEAAVDLGDRARVGVRASANAGKLAHPAPPFVAAGGRRWDRLGSPRVVYALDLGVRF